MKFTTGVIVFDVDNRASLVYMYNTDTYVYFSIKFILTHFKYNKATVLNS